MKTRRFCACIMALLLAVSMPLTALADDWYLENGDISVSAEVDESGGTTQTVSQKHSDTETTTKKDNSPTITHKESGTSTSNTVTITAGENATANVTLNGVNISGADGAAIQTSGGGNVNIELDGNNTVQSGNNHAGVEKNNSGNLTITDDNKITGTLTATGGTGGAGIGGGKGSNGSNITISGGTVTANGGEGGAGIGGGASGAGSGITIKGGTVNAKGGTDAAGIGGGYDGDGNNITISGSTTTATGGDPWQQRNEDGNVVEEKPGGGAGIGGGAYGEGNNITVKYTAQVTATGKGNAANIGNGYASEATEKQKDNVDLSGLSSFGNVNGVPGSDGGYHASNGSSSSSASLTIGNKAPSKGGLTVSDNNGNSLSSALWLEEEGTLKVTAPSNNVLVTGNKADLLQLKEDGVKKINLQTNRVNVSVTNELLQKITGTGGFQLAADDTTVSLSSADGNNQKTPGLKLTADKQPEKGKLQVDFRSEESKEGAGDVRESLNKTLQVSTNAPEATLSLEQKYLQTLQNSEFSKLALAVGNLITTVDSMLAANTAVNGSGSISIDDESVIMNGFKFSAGDSSENDQLTDMVTNIKFKKEITPVGGSAMVVEVDAKAPMKSASLKVPGSALQSLIDQGVEETALSINGKTTSINNSNLREQIDDSKPGIPAAITVKDLNILVP